MNVKPSRPLAERNPVAFAVMLSMIVVAVVLSITIAIGGSYALTIHYVNQYAAQKKTLDHKAKLAADHIAVEGSIPECTALIALDAAGKDGNIKLVVPPGVDPTSTYGYRLSHAIHRVVDASSCPELLKDKKMGLTDEQIIKDLTPKK